MALPQSVHKSRGPLSATGLDAALPLYKRAPCTDERGKPLSDFMMIIPQLRNRTQAQIEERIEKIHRVLERFAHLVVFADLNLKINVLWVIVRPSPGACVDIPLAIIAAVPEALLVAHPRFNGNTISPR